MAVVITFTFEVEVFLYIFVIKRRIFKTNIELYKE